MTSNLCFVEMFDTHCHLQDDAFAGDLAAVLDEAASVGVTHVMAPATDVASFEKTLAITSAYPNVYGALGVHPHSASEWSDDVRAKISDRIAASNKIRAIGEIGLDYHYNFSPPDVQRTAFAAQIALAQQLQMPIVVHIRESDEDVFRVLHEHYDRLPKDAPRGQLHCFSSTVERMQEAVELGFYVSFTGNITFKKSTLSEVVLATPLERLLIETDSPYLTPHPFRGQRNSPARVRLVAEAVAAIKQMDVNAVIKQTFINALQFFRITPLLVLFVTLLASTAFAQREQPAGSAPPDSVLTPERRRAEELRKQQEVILAKEAEQRRQDSIKQAEKDIEESLAHIRDQQRQDSLKAVQRIAEQQAHEAFLQTPMPWRAIGVGFAAGIGDMPMFPATRSLIPLSVFSYTIDASSAITRRLDVDLSFSQMVVGEPFPQDSMWGAALTGPPQIGYNPNGATEKANLESGNSMRLISSEYMTVQTYGIDLRYVITKPDALLKFYFGLGYGYIHSTNAQHYSHAKPLPAYSDNTDNILEGSWNRGSIKLFFGMRHDFELGNGLTLEPFAQIAGFGVFQGEKVQPYFVLQPDPEQIIMTQFNVGFTLFYGWFGVPRL